MFYEKAKEALKEKSQSYHAFFKTFNNEYMELYVKPRFRNYPFNAN